MELFEYDTKANGGWAASMFRKMILEDKVNMVMGSISSTVQKACFPLAEQYKIPFFGGGAMTSAGGTDWVVAKLSGAAGAHLFSGRLGGTGNDTGLGLALDGSGNRYLTGSFESSLNM